MPTVEEAFARFCQLSNDLKNLLKYVKYSDYQDLSGISVNYEDPDEMQMLNTMRMAAEAFGDAAMDISYLQVPVVRIGTLHLNAGGRYERDDGFEYTCGDSIEFLRKADGDYNSHDCWVCSSVESAENGYYIVHNSSVNMEGLTVRIRSRW